MITLKIKYSTNSENHKIIKDIIRQYTICYKVISKYISKGLGKKEIVEKLKLYKNVNSVVSNSWFMNCLFYDVKCLNKKNVCFNKLLLIKRMKGLISKDEYKDMKYFKLSSNGEKDKKGNRFFKINKDLTVLFKPNKNIHISLDLLSIGKNRVNILNKLYQLQEENNIIPITYYLDSNYIYISFDETLVNNVKTKKIKNRIFSIDMNPNYIGYSVIDWKSSDDLDYKIIDSGVISMKEINDKFFDMKSQHNTSSDKRRLYITNKRKFECFEVSKQLTELAKHYQCEVFALENLTIKSSDKSKGKRFNSLCNNLWNRTKLVNNLTKRCNIYNIKIIKVVANWSSVIGNILYNRNNLLPDMVLSSIEISRRAYEFNLQYLKKEKEITKHIIFPNLTEKVRCLINQTMEVLNIRYQFDKMSDLCYFLKKNLGNKYRVPLNESRVFSQRHLKYQLIQFNQ